MDTKMNGLDILLSFEAPLRNKLIATSSALSGPERATILSWIINGNRQSVMEALELWETNNWGVQELQTLAWCARYGRQNDWNKDWVNRK